MRAAATLEPGGSSRAFPSWGDGSPGGQPDVVGKGLHLGSAPHLRVASLSSSSLESQLPWLRAGVIKYK